MVAYLDKVILYYQQIVFRDMRTDCVGGVPISQWASRAPLAEISPHGWGIHSFDSITHVTVFFHCF